MAMTLVSTVTVGSGGASDVTFSNIPQNGKDLVFLGSIRSSNINTTFYVSDGMVYFNGNNTNQTRLFVEGLGSGTPTSNSSTYGNNFWVPNDSTTSNTFGSFQFYLSNYTSSSNKSFSVESVTENNNTIARQYIIAGRIDDTNPITSATIDIFGAGNNLMQYSTISLYIIS